MDYSRLLLRMARLARHPPSWRSVMIGLIVLVIVGIIFGIEAAGYWPEWAEAGRVGRPRIITP